MSLRREIHAAFETIAPPLGGMPERVVQTVLRDSGGRRERKLMLRLRAPVSLVAVFVAIAVIAAVLVGGRVIRDWNLFHNANPAGHAQTTQLQLLEARPLTLPVLKSVSDCTSGPFSPDGNAVGSGPLFGYGGAGPWTAWGDYFTFVLYTDASVSGPILVRARDLVKNLPVVFVGKYSDGQVMGRDTVKGATVTQRSEAVLYADTAVPVTDNPPLQPHAYEWGVMGGLPKFSTISTGWQVDGLNFSETFELC